MYTRWGKSKSIVRVDEITTDHGRRDIERSAEGSTAQIATDLSQVSARLLREWVAALVQAAAIPQLARVMTGRCSFGLDKMCVVLTVEVCYAAFR
jgi:hypothetical protein